jgi:uncharacterized protein (TIGR02687 family)
MNILQELVKQFRIQKESLLMPHRAIVFWYDTNSNDRNLDEIKEVLASHNVKVWKLDKNNAFETKVMLEIEDPNSSYLLYAPFEKPIDEDNNLLDILLYSGKYGEFQADEIAITMKELGIDHLAIRAFIEKHWLFFKDKRRKEKFRKLLPIEVTEEQVKLIMLAVLTGASTFHIPDIVRSVMGKGMIEGQNEAIQKIDKFFDRNVFYSFAESYFGIRPEHGDRLKYLVSTIVYNHFVSEVDFELTPSFRVQYPSNLPNTSRVFLDDWFQSRDHENLNEILQMIEGDWGIAGLLLDQPYTLFQRCDTFPVIDSILIDTLVQQLINETVNFSEWKGILQQRKMKHWYKTEWFALRYELLNRALDVYKMKEQYALIEEPRDPKQWITTYTTQYYAIDQAYRKLMSVYQSTNHFEMAETLVKQLTNWYENEYLANIAETTERLLEEGLAKKWPLFELLKQKDFYRTFISPVIEGTQERVFVIISDALRYEIADELNQDFQTHLNSETSLMPMQASLPSYTQLGMASLLPGKVSGIRADGTVEVNNHSTKGTANREKILQQAEAASSAYQLNTFMSLNKEEGIQAVKGKRVIYLYHDRIDATGDNGKSEYYTFEAVEQAISDLKQAVKKLVGTFAASRLYITSDHGFLYQSSNVENHQKAVAVQGDIIDSNRRFAIGRNLIVPEGARRISMDYLGLELESVIAKDLNRFKSSGGLKFVHGGAMPQEAIVPVLEYRQIKGKNRKKTAERVDVHVASRNKVITNYRFKVAFFQEKKVSESLYSRSLRAAFYKEEERISNEVTLTFDSVNEASERQQEVTFSLLESNYKTGDRCVLRMEDVSTAKTGHYHEEEFELRLYHIK